MRLSPGDRRKLLVRVGLALVSLWVALSIIFLLFVGAPGEFLVAKLSNLENQGAGQRLEEVVGEVEVGATTKSYPAGSTLPEIAENEGLSLTHLSSLNPQIDPRQPLSRSTVIVLLDGELLRDLVVWNRLVLPEDAAEGIELLKSHNPEIAFLSFRGHEYAPAGAALTLHRGISVADFARVRRITTEDILEVNPRGSAANPHGRLRADSVLQHGDQIILPLTRMTEAAIRHRLGLDRSVGGQYMAFLWDAVRFDFDTSFQSQESALGIVAGRLAGTAQLNLFALIVALAIGAPLGLLASGVRGLRAARVGRLLSALALVAPSFWLALLLIVAVTPEGLFEGGLWSIPLTDPDARNISDSPSQFFKLYSIPAVSGGLLLAGLVAISIRRRVKAGDGAGRRTSTIQAVIDPLRVYLPAMIGLNLVLEVMFNLQGLGLLLIQRIIQADLPVIIAVASVTALFLVWSFLALDGARALLERREQTT